MIAESVTVRPDFNIDVFDSITVTDGISSTNVLTNDVSDAIAITEFVSVYVYKERIIYTRKSNTYSNKGDIYVRKPDVYSNKTDIYKRKPNVYSRKE